LLQDSSLQCIRRVLNIRRQLGQESEEVEISWRQFLL
jgi:hypothetical protein